MEISRETQKASLTEKTVWLLFCATCIQLAFLEPWLLLIPGERANVFSGELCAITLAAAFLVARTNATRITEPEVLVSIGLLALATASGLLSLTPRSSTVRALVVMASGLGGFWCARILLNTPEKQRSFAWLCLGILIVEITACFWGYHDSGQINEFVYSGNSLGGNRLHQLIHILFLLTFAPLALIAWGRPLRVLVGFLLLGLTYLVLFFAGVQAIDSGVLIPPVLLFLIALLGAGGPKVTSWLLIIMVVFVAVAANFVEYFSKKDHSDIQYQSLRVESYRFSWHVAKKHPIFGIGLRSPREEFLEDYDVWHPQLRKQDFASSVKNEVTSENIFLTLMVGLGIPFTIGYVTILIILLVRLLRAVFRPPPGQALHPLVLLIPLVASLLHSFTTDTFMSPQLTWYFHILLGLIPVPAAAVTAPQRTWRTVLVRATAAFAAVILGIFLGTHPAFAPDKLPSKESIYAYGKEVPILKLFLYEREKPRKAEEDLGPVARVSPRPSVDIQNPEPAATEESAPGTLMVNIRDYKGFPPKWAVMFILDNSEAMSKRAEPWSPDRLSAARHVVADLVKGMPQGSKIAIRDFFDEVSGRKKGREIRLRVSQVVVDWVDTPSPGLESSLDGLAAGGEDNLCTAAVHALKSDFTPVKRYSPRLVLITDGHKECLLKELIQAVEQNKSGDHAKVDVVAVGMKAPLREAYAGLAEVTGGEFIKVDQPQDVQSALRGYSAALRTERVEPIQVVGEGAGYKILPGEEARLPAGSYSLVLPDIAGLDSSKRDIKGVKIESGKMNVLDLRIEDGHPVIQVKEP
jgi:hypothetical protein